MTLPAFAAERWRLHSTAPAARPQLFIDVSCRQGAQQQTRRPPLLLSIDGTDKRTERWTDGRTYDRYIDSVWHIMRATSITISRKPSLEVAPTAEATFRLICS